MKQNEKLLLTSFIFTVFVVWLHAGEPLLSYVPGQVAVPGFFLLSGFLFMKGIPADHAAAGKEADAEDAAAGKEADAEEAAAGKEADAGEAAAEKETASEKAAITGKLRRRVRTLVIPYLLWNAVYFVIYLVTGRAQISEIFEAIFLYRCNPVFWYMFQLILITILAPALYYIMKKGRAAALLLLAAVFALAVFYAKLPFHYCNEDALFYYSLGAYITLRGTYGDGGTLRGACLRAQTALASLKTRLKARTRRNPPSPVSEQQPDPSLPENSGQSERIATSPASGQVAACCTRRTEQAMRGVPSAAKLALTVALTVAFLLVEGVLPPELRNISEVGYRAAGALAVYFLVDMVWEQRGGIEIRPWMKVNFFIYATHYMVIRLVWALEIAVGFNGSQTANIITYLLMPAICISAAYGLSVIMKKYVPKVYSVLTGGR